MKGKLCCFVIILQLMSWVCVKSRPISPNDGHVVPQSGSAQSPESLKVFFSLEQGLKKGTDGMGEEMEETASYKGVNKIGSRPPSCEDKCYGCNPCEAIQVPTNTNLFRAQYTNYEPEGWKCKCGPSFYSP